MDWAGLVLYSTNKGSLWTLFSLSLMMAGALGNFIDRVRLGYVVDMFHLDFINFPIFNVADICLSVWGWIVIYMYIERRV